ncbi:MAG: hypothetical protein JNG89_07240 [Planctomycetaceae bacterium]|nr:hypothetical protein [Planctomycetaceae bacterium]
MLTAYHTDGLQFQYPSDWELAEEQQPDGLSIVVSSPGTAFCSFLLMPERPPVARVLKTALEAFRETYDEIDSEDVECRIDGRAARGIDVDFYCLELVNAAWLRAFRTGKFTVFVLFQSGFDEPDARAIFDAICASIDCNSQIRTSP